MTKEVLAASPGAPLMTWCARTIGTILSAAAEERQTVGEQTDVLNAPAAGEPIAAKQLALPPRGVAFVGTPVVQRAEPPNASIQSEITLPEPRAAGDAGAVSGSIVADVDQRGKSRIPSILLSNR